MSDCSPSSVSSAGPSFFGFGAHRIMSHVQGVGTAIGELPPYFVARTGERWANYFAKWFTSDHFHAFLANPRPPLPGPAALTYSAPVRCGTR